MAPEPAPPPDLPRAHVFVIGLAAVCAVHRPPTGVVWEGEVDRWLKSLLELLALEREALPTDVPPEDVAEVAAERTTWSGDEQLAMARALIQAALAPDKSVGDKKQPRVVYAPVARAAAHSTLELLGLDAALLLPRAEAALASTLAEAVGSDNQAVEQARDKQKQGWGGKLGRSLGGVIAGGVLLGVTGGLAAPALLALMAPLGLGAVLSGVAAPIVLGTLFGLTGGGLAGWRVNQRWRGVDDFQFIEVGANSKPTKEEVEDLKKHQERQGDDVGGIEVVGESELLFEAPNTDTDDEEDAKAKREARRKTAKQRQELEDQLAQLSLEAGTVNRTPVQTPPPEPEDDRDVVKELKEKHPSLTATIVVPGLLTVCRTEALASWRAVCARDAPAPKYRVRRKPKKAMPEAKTLEEAAEVAEQEAPVHANGLKDGRDVYLLKYETGTMLSTGRDLEAWVMTKATRMAGTEVVKATALGAYYAAIALPLSVYTIGSMTLDNSWAFAQDKAVKAGRLLGEVLAQGVQGARPVVLVGTSLGALTVLHALLHLASLPDAGPTIVESVFLVSLPSAPTSAEWAAVRKVTARRLVNAYSGSDFVLASIVRLHEVVSRGVTGNNGVKVAGLGPVQMPGVEDIDLNDVLNGHAEINTRAGEILHMLEVDD